MYIHLTKITNYMYLFIQVFCPLPFFNPWGVRLQLTHASLLMHASQSVCEYHLHYVLDQQFPTHCILYLTGVHGGSSWPLHRAEGGNPHVLLPVVPHHLHHQVPHRHGVQGHGRLPQWCKTAVTLLLTFHRSHTLPHTLHFSNIMCHNVHMYIFWVL